MRKRIFPLLLSFLLILVVASPISAATIQFASGQLASGAAPSRGVIAVSSDKAAFYVVVPSRGSEPDSAPEAAVYGPFLSGELGRKNKTLSDVEITADGKTALFSHSIDPAIFFVDITQPLTPKVKGHLEPSFEPQGIALTADSRYALVTGNKFTNKIASIDIQSMSLVEEFTLPVDNSDPASPQDRYAVSVVTAPNGTVIAVDYFEHSIYTLLIDNTGHLSFVNTYRYFVATDGTASETRDSADFYCATPSNAVLAPDGQTLLIIDRNYYSKPMDPERYNVGVFQLTGPGELEFKGAVTGLTRVPNSVAFDASGKKVYLSGNGGIADGDTDNGNDKLTLLKITAPGVVSLDQAAFADLNRQSCDYRFGIDSLAIQGDLIVAGYDSYTKSPYHLSIIDGISQKALYINDLGLIYSVKAIPPLKVFLPITIRQ